MRLLIVEDEQALRDPLADNLQQQGYAVDTAADGREGLFCGSEIDYDLAIIDIGLPQLSGIELIKQLRQQGKKFPILILTARGDWQDKVEGLEAGADDYLVKPFHYQELHARLNALLRRSVGRASTTVSFGPLQINTAAKIVTLHSTELELTGYEYKTLEYLAHHPGKTISKHELTEHLYAQDFDRDSNVIEVFVGRLRKKIDPDSQLKPITTIRGQGYRFILTPTEDKESPT